MRLLIIMLLVIFNTKEAYAFDCNYRKNGPTSTSGFGGTAYGFAVREARKSVNLFETLDNNWNNFKQANPQAEKNNYLGKVFKHQNTFIYGDYKPGGIKYDPAFDVNNACFNPQPEISVFLEEKQYLTSPKSFGGHIGIRIDNTLYEIKPISKGNATWEARPYNDMLNSPRSEREVPVNFLSFEQSIQLQQNIINSVGNKTIYEWTNNNCVNALKDHFGKVGAIFPNDPIDTPVNMLNQTKIMNQTYTTPYNWQEIGRSFNTSSYDMPVNRINTFSNIETGITKGVGAVVAPQLLPYIKTPVTSPSRFQPTFPSMPPNRYNTFQQVNKDYGQFRKIYPNPVIQPIIPPKVTPPQTINPFKFNSSMREITR
ncbi:MAG: hypothetical protein JSV30_02260 [Candidatus Omnitrophota bacterium]|nr:MAG: hypothetical protein JSV30_02260 [Candidatus Omnitrophota bacterium]